MTMQAPRRNSTLRQFLIFLFCGGTLWFVSHVGLSVWDGLSDELGHADVAVVFGNQVYPNGQPSLRLQKRLERTLLLYRKGLFSQVIASGGTGKEGVDEAKAMKRYLVARGIPAAAIWADGLGVNTYATLDYTARLLRKKKWRSVLVISQYYHVSRVKLACARFGIKKVYSAHAVYHFEWREFYSIFREFFGYYAYLFKSYPSKS